MKTEITITLNPAELEIVSRVLRTVHDVMKPGTELDEWVADYESFILDMKEAEYDALENALGKI